MDDSYCFELKRTETLIPAAALQIISATNDLDVEKYVVVPLLGRLDRYGGNHTERDLKDIGAAFAWWRVQTLAYSRSQP